MSFSEEEKNKALQLYDETGRCGQILGPEMTGTSKNIEGQKEKKYLRVR